MNLPTNRGPTELDLARIRANVFPEAWAAIGDPQRFSWHRDRQKGFDGHLLHSSQSFCISVWATIGLDDAIGVRAALLGPLNLDVAHEDAPEVTLEYVDRSLLGETGQGVPTNIDALVRWSGLAVIVESKLGEPLGRCRQPPKHCTGRYEAGSDLKTGTAYPCRLQVRDGSRGARKYWEVMERVTKAGALDPGQRCPFWEGYQVMRNIAFAFEFGRVTGCDWRVVFAMPRGASARSARTVEEVAQLLTDESRSRVTFLDYEAAAIQLQALGDDIAARLGKFMERRLAEVRS